MGGPIDSEFAHRHVIYPMLASCVGVFMLFTAILDAVCAPSLG
jgi:hypothetical protein